MGQGLVNARRHSPPITLRRAFSALNPFSSFSFHSSPESFLASLAPRPAARSTLEDEVFRHKQSVIRARILNRNVAIVTSRQLCEAILHAGSGDHQTAVTAASKGETIVNDHIGNWAHGSTIDLYDSMKDLSWRVLLGTFLQLGPADKTYSEIATLQETLLRGQFSLFPVSVNTPFWQSPRAKAIKARAKLQTLLKDRMLSQEKDCPFLRLGKVNDDEIASKNPHFFLVRALITMIRKQ
ncbi:hypothetical protein V1506DRAFT_523244 [Lipomyces tetrasporus]